MPRPYAIVCVLTLCGLMLSARGYVMVVPESTPAHAWFLGDLDGRVVRDRCAQAHGTLVGEYNGELGAQRPGMLLLDGDGDFVHVEGNLFHAEGMTVMGWVRTFRIGGVQTLIDVAGRGEAEERVALGVDFIRGAHVWVSYAGTTYVWNERLPISTRTHLAAACSPEGVALYIDGHDMGPHNGNPVPTPAVEVGETTFIGRANLAEGSSSGFYGEIEQASIYNAFLTADEVALAMHAAKKEGYTDLFEHGAGPTEHWDDFDGNGFSEQVGLLEANGFHGPHHIMATAPTTDHEVSFWYRYTDYRDRKDIGAGEQTIRFSIRRDLWGIADLYVEISPETFAVHERIGRTISRVRTNDQVKSEPNAWYSVRMRVVGDAIRVWRRSGDGTWAEAVISADGVLANSYTGARYGFTIDAPAGGCSEYSLDNFRVRPYRGDIDANVGEIDVHRLTVAAPAEGSSSIVPRGGVYPHQECVYVAAEGTGDYVFEGWEPVDADLHNAPNAQDLRITLEAAATLTPKLRPRYCGSAASYHAAPYDSTYAPAGYTTFNFAELTQTYTLDHCCPKRFVPGESGPVSWG